LLYITSRPSSKLHSSYGRGAAEEGSQRQGEEATRNFAFVVPGLPAGHE
jgi:hypothetical protein